MFLIKRIGIKTGHWNHSVALKYLHVLAGFNAGAIKFVYFWHTGALYQNSFDK